MVGGKHLINHSGSGKPRWKSSCRLLMKMPRGILITYVCDSVGSSAVPMKIHLEFSSLYACGWRASCTFSYEREPCLLLEWYRWNRYVEMHKQSLVKWKCCTAWTHEHFFAAPSNPKSLFCGKSARKTVFRSSSRRVRIHGSGPHPSRVQLMPGFHQNFLITSKIFEVIQ